MITTTNLTKSYIPGAPASLKDLNLHIAPREIFCLLGSNGAGKTTTINLLLGFLKPTSGSASIGGIEVARNPLRVRRLLAYLPEQVALYPQLTGLENLRFFTALAGLKLSEAQLADHLIKAGLPEKVIHSRVSTYSKGMRQKTGLAYALAKRAQALFLDEPTSGLDPSAANELGRALQNLAGEGTAVLMATHDIYHAHRIGDRAGIMREGKLQEVCATRKLSATELEERYIAQVSP